MTTEKDDGLAPPEPGYIDAENPEVRLGWRIDSIGAMEWALTRLADCRERIAEIEAATKEAVERVMARGARLVEQAVAGERFFEAAIEHYATTERANLLRGGKKGAKSRKFINGAIGWRTAPGRLVVQDEKALLAWCEAQPIEQGFTRVKTEPDLRKVQEHAQATGIIPDGCEWVGEKESFSVKAQNAEAIEVHSKAKEE